MNTDTIIEQFNSEGIRAAARERREPGYLVADTNADPLLGEDAEEALERLRNPESEN